MQPVKRCCIMFVLILVAGLLVACGDPTATPLVPTATPAPTATPNPTATPIPPTATPNPTATAAAKATDSAIGAMTVSAFNTVRANINATSTATAQAQATFNAQATVTAQAQATVNAQATIAALPKPLNFAGTGGKVTSKFNLNKGLVKISATHKGSGYFAVKLINSDGEMEGLAANAVKNYSGSSYIDVSQAGEYLLEITADGAWTADVFDWVLVKAEPPAQQSNTYKGTGKAALKIVPAKAGLTVFKTTHKGSGYFGITAYDKNGEYGALIANGVNNFSGEKAYKVDLSEYYLDIQAEGDWTIELS